MARLHALPTVVAWLCVLAWLPWSLGVPGVEGTPFARGWLLGLLAILVYPPAILVLALAAFAFRRFGGPVKALFFHRLRFVALAAFAAVQVAAWAIMLD